MKHIRCTFTRTENVNLNLWENNTGKMLYDLSLLGKEEIDDLSLKHYVITLAGNAKPLEKNPEMSFFGYDEPSHMPSDCRVEYFYKPSYVATMFLMKAVLIDPSLLEERMATKSSDNHNTAPTLREVLKHCMLGCTGRGFMGSGIDDIEGLAETMLLFSENGTGRFLEKYGNICPEFTNLYHKRIEMFRSAVDNGGLKGLWNDDHTPIARQVLQIHEG